MTVHPTTNAERLDLAARCASNAVELMDQVEQAHATGDGGRGMSELVARAGVQATLASALCNVVQASVALATAPPVTRR